MSRIVYVNGEYLPEEDAKISVFDRGFLFADGVYEVTSVLDGKLVDNAAHMARLQRSLEELGMASPLPPQEIEAVQSEMVARNNLVEGGLYLQVTRGAADRDFSVPKDAKPSLVMFTQAKKLADNPAAQRGWSVILIDDIRWRRRDIKTVQLLAPSLAKQAALDAGADDAWMVEDGHNDILHGITRRAVMAMANRDGITFEERAFTPQEAKEADEAFVTSATAFVMPVVKIDGQLIGNGNPGTVTMRLRQLYIEEALRG
jgi:D-alanine transaminase